MTVPDAARGKLIRCPKCQTKFRVPASSAPKKAKAASPDEEDPLASLDLSQLEDRSVRVCPKCGTQVDEEAIECPNCFVDLTTGVLSEAARRRLARKGFDPAIYYKGVWKDAWQFTLENKSIVFRTIWYFTFWTLVSIGCTMLLTWCRNVPPRVFWGFVATITGLAPIGWIWHLDMEIIKSTLNRDERLPRINFDFFTCVALGIKCFSWTAAIFVQTVVGPLGVALVVFGYTVPGAVLIGLGLLVAVVLFPIAITHMAMPVTWPSWVINKLGKAFIQAAGPVLYCLLVLVVTSLPVLGVAGGVAAWKGRDVARVVGTMVYNFKLPPPESTDTSGEQGANAAASQQKDLRKPIEWKALIVPGVGLVIVLALGGFVAVYNMRSNGLMAFVAKPRLGLITIRKEKKYVPKRTERKQFDPSALSSVNLNRIQWATWLYLGSYGLVALALLIVLAGAVASGIRSVAFLVALGLAVLSFVTNCASLILFLAVPAETGAPVYIFTSLGLAAIGMGLRVARRFVADSVLQALLLNAGDLSRMLSHVVFLAFVVLLAKLLRKKAVAKSGQVAIGFAVLALVSTAVVAGLGAAILFFQVKVTEAVAKALTLGAAAGTAVGALGSLVATVLTLWALGAALEDLQRKQKWQRRRRSEE